MGVLSGEAAQFMIATETTYGTYVAPTRSLEMTDENLKLKIERIESKGLRAGRRLTGKWLPGRRSAAGDVGLEMSGLGMGLLLQHAFGSCVVTGAGPTYSHTATIGDLPVGFTAQVGRPDVSGVIDPFTYTGSRVNTWELALKAGELLMMKLGIFSQDETTAQTLTTFADPNVALLSYVGGVVTSAGVQVDLLDFQLKGDNKLDNQRFRLRNAATAKQSLENSWREVTGQLTADFEGLTQYNHYVNGDELSLVATFTGGLIPAGGGVSYKVVVTCNVRYDGDTPVVPGPALISQPLPIKVIGSGATDALALSVVVTTGDAAL